jgi:hypothetical protein
MKWMRANSKSCLSQNVIFRTTALFLAFLALLPLNSGAQNTAPNPVPGKKAAEANFDFSNTSYKPSNHRDPFLNPLLYKKNGTQNEDQEESRGLPPPGIAGTYIAQATLQGISVRDTGRVAIVRGADTRAYFLRQGDRLFDGYLKFIDTDSITLVRETKMRSGKVLIQDVTKRLRTP